jgi:hypothetical protein
MALTPEHRAELEVLGPETVRVRLVTVISGFKTSTTTATLMAGLQRSESKAKVNVANGRGLFKHMFAHPLQRRLFCYRWT